MNVEYVMILWKRSWFLLHVKWVADGGDGLQVWMVTANILNKQSWAANKGWSFKTYHVTELHTGPRPL